MKNVNIKERTAVIRKLHTYGLTPVEEAIVKLIEDLAGVEDQPQEPVVTEDEPTEPVNL